MSERYISLEKLKQLLEKTYSYTGDDLVRVDEIFEYVEETMKDDIVEISELSKET